MFFALTATVTGSDTLILAILNPESHYLVLGPKNRMSESSQGVQRRAALG